MSKKGVNDILKKKKAAIGLISLLLIVIIGFFIHSAFFVPDKEEDPVVDIDPSAPSDVDGTLSDPKPEKPDETGSLSQVQVDLVEYTTYCFDDLNFDFIIAKIRVKAEDSINISLDHFITSEGIALDDIDSYLSILDSNNLYVGKQRVQFELLSTESSMVANIFIPVKDKKAKTVTVSTDFNRKNNLVFSLETATGTKEMLGYHAEDVITDGKTYELKISNVIDVTGEDLYITENGNSNQEFYSSSTRIYAFYVDAVSLWGDEVVIEDARYVTDSQIEFNALDGRYSTMKRDNIIGKAIKEAESAPILFMTLNYEENPIIYQGTLKIKIKGQDKWIEIRLSL